MNHLNHQATEHFETRANETRWPRSSELRKNKKPFKLREIRYKIQEKENCESLAGIQLLFTNEIETPFFESEKTKNSGWKVRSVKVNPEKNIESIGMCFTSEGFAKGLRLTSDEGFFLFDEFWHSNGRDKNNFDFQN